MPLEDNKVAVVGAGAIGGVTAAFLARAGWDVQIVCKHGEIVDRCSSPGLHVVGIRGESYTPLKAVRDISDLSGPLDTVLLATKATDCVSAARELLPLLSDDSRVVSLQNGISEDALAQVLGPNRVVGCVVGWGATMLGPGELQVTSPGDFIVGYMDGRRDEHLTHLKNTLDAVAPTRVSANIIGELYSKLIVNSCINCLGAITGQPLGELLASVRVRNIFIDLMLEAMAVAEAIGIKVEPGGGGKLDYYEFLRGKGALARFKRHVVIRIVGFKFRRIRSSSLQSLERGRPTEVDYLNGYICSRARESNVPTPLNDAIVSIIKEIEAGQRKIQPENLDDPRLKRLVQ
jgi:2-dehydropantoate 2-reductase